MARYGAWVAVLLLTCYLVFVGGGWAGLYESSLRTASVALAAGVLLAWVIVAWRSPEWRPRSVLLPAIVAAIGSLAVSTVFSRFPRQSVEYLGYAILLAALYLLLVRILANPFLRVRMGSVAVVLCGTISVAFVWLVVSQWLRLWALIGRLTVPPLRPGFESLTFGNPAAVMTITLLLLASAVATLGFGSRARIASLGFLATLVAFAALASGSRAGWLAAAVALALSGAVAILVPEGRRQLLTMARLTLTSAATRVTVGALGIVGLVGAITLGPGVLQRFGAGGEDLRAAYLAVATRMFTEAPVFGTGPGTWVIQRVRYTVPPEPDFYIPHAHNIYAQTFSELGVVGAVAGLVLLVTLVRLVGGAIRDPDPDRRRWGWVAVFVLVYFGTHQLLDFYANAAAILFAAALPVAWLDANRSDDRRPQPARLGRGAGLAGVVSVIASALAVGGLLLSEKSAATNAAAVTAYERGEWSRADELAQLAALEDPRWPPYDFTAGLAAAAVGDHARAADAFRRAAEADDLPESWLDLAAEELLLGNEPEARLALARAARLGLQRPALAMAIGDLASILGDADLEKTAFVTALVEIPSLAGDPWWQADPDRAARFSTFLDASIGAAPPGIGWQIALAAGDLERARDLLPRASSVAGSVALVDVIAAWDGDDVARSRVISGCDRSPMNSTAVDWCARLSARAGNVGEANRYREWSFLLLGDPAGPFEVRVSDHPMLGRSIQGDVAEFYGTYTYRRPTPWNPFVPSLVQLTLA